MRVTINKIAELAQVSKCTVSKALNDKPGVGKETRDRILSLARMLDFQPDSSARALALQKTGIIGLLIPHESVSALSGNYWPLVLTGVSEQATKLQLNLLVLTLPREGDIQGAVNQIMKRNTVDGLIIGSELLDKAIFSQLIISKLPFILLGQNPDFNHFCVDVDSAQGTGLMLRHMLAHGYRKIGALLGPGLYPYTRERHGAYHRVLDEAGIPWRGVAFSDYYTQDTGVSTHALLDAHPDMDALYIASGGQFFLDAFRAVQERGLQVPQFGLGTYDDSVYFDFIQPKITAVRQPTYDTGVAAVQMLLRLIDGEPVAPIVRLENSLIVRESCAEARIQ